MLVVIIAALLEIGGLVFLVTSNGDGTRLGIGVLAVFAGWAVWVLGGLHRRKK